MTMYNVRLYSSLFSLSFPSPSSPHPPHDPTFNTPPTKQEDEELFARTMSGVMKNIAHLCTRDRSKTWGKEGWKKVVVCIVSDGRSKVNARTLSSIATIGCYQDGVAKVRLHELWMGWGREEG